MSIAIFLGLTIDKPIEPRHERGFITVMIWCAAFDVLALFALFSR